MILLFYCFDACSEVSLIIPVATHHIINRAPDIGDDGQFSNENYGLGVAYTHKDKYEVGALYLKEDSFSNENYYFYVARRFRFTENIISAVSLYLPTSYSDEYSNSNINVAPMFSLQYRFIRIVTTYPFGKLVDSESDIINVQLVIPFKF